MEPGGIDSYLPILVVVLIPAWASCRWYRRSRQSPIISPHATIKTGTGSAIERKVIGICTRNSGRQEVASSRTDIMKISGAFCLSLFGLYSLVAGHNNNINHVSRRQSSATNSSSVLVDFEVYKPVEFNPPSKGCDQVILLMDYSFGYSYGEPFVGQYSICLPLFEFLSHILVQENLLHPTATLILSESTLLSHLGDGNLIDWH